MDSFPASQLPPVGSVPPAAQAPALCGPFDNAFTLDRHGILVGVRSNDASWLQNFWATQIPSHWTDDALPGGVDFLLTLWRNPAGGWHEVWLNDELLARCANEWNAIKVGGNRLHTCIAENSPVDLFLHAGVLVFQNRAILLPGRSHFGKSSLTLALARAGAQYYSDDHAVIDAQGRVHHYPVPLSRRCPDGSTQFIPAGELGWREDSGPVPVGLVLCSCYSPEMEIKLRRVRRGQIVLRLFNNAVAARRLGAQGIQVLTQAAAGAVGWVGIRGEAEDTAEWILRQMKEM